MIVKYMEIRKGDTVFDAFNDRYITADRMGAGESNLWCMVDEDNGSAPYEQLLTFHVVCTLFGCKNWDFVKEN